MKPWRVCIIEEYESNGEKKSKWMDVGIAWPFKSGEGFSIELKSLPIDGKLKLVPPREDKEQGQTQWQP